MGTNWVCDTNVLYDCAAGVLLPAAFMDEGDTMAITPVSILEIASKLSPKTFDERRAAAAKAIELEVEIVPDPEQHLASIWGVQVTEEVAPWKDGLIAIANATDVAQVELGVADVQGKVVRSVKIGAAHAWRSYHYSDFVAQMVQAVDQFVPGYAKKRSQGKLKQQNPQTVARLRLEFGGPAALLEILLATRDRAMLASAGPTPPALDQATIERAIENLIGYVGIYSRYFEKVATAFAPQDNDWGDLECFLYLQGNNQVATGEDRWIGIADEIGLGHLVLDTKLHWKNA